MGDGGRFERFLLPAGGWHAACIKHGQEPTMRGHGQLDGMRVAPPAFAMEAGPAQRQLESGMSAIDVVEMLGSPRIVTRGPDGREAWAWDHVSRGAIGVRGPTPGLLAGAGVGTAPFVSVIVRFAADLRVSSVGVHAPAAA